MSSNTSAASGVSPAFSVSSEQLRLRHRFGITMIAIEGVHPPVPTPDGGFSHAMELTNKWSPWVDEKIVPPKYDGVCQFTGTPSNQPTYVKDYHMLALWRAVDDVLKARFHGYLMVHVDSPAPIPPPTR